MEKKDRIKDRKRNFIHRPGKGFTMVELLVVLAVLAVLAAVVIPLMFGFTDSAKEKKYVEEANKALTAAQTMLSDVYTDNLKYVPRRMRLQAAENADLPGSEFTVYTVSYFKNTADGTSASISAYTIAAALYKSSDGKYLYYDGNNWEMIESNDSHVLNAKSGNYIDVWPDTEYIADSAGNSEKDDEQGAEGSEPHYTTDDDTKENDKNTEYIVEEDDAPQSDKEVVIPVVFRSDDKSVYFLGGKDTYIVENARFSSKGFSISPNPQVDSVYYKPDSIVFEYEKVDGSKETKNYTELVSYLYQEAKKYKPEDTIPTYTFHATADENTISIPIVFHAFKDETLTVGLSDNAEQNTINVEYGMVSKVTDEDIRLSDVSVSYNHDKVDFDGVWYAEDKNGLIDGNKGTVKSDDDLHDAIDNWVSSNLATINPNGNMTVSQIEETGLSFIAYADVKKSVYVRGILTDAGSLKGEVSFGNGNQTVQMLKKDFIRNEKTEEVYTLNGNEKGEKVSFSGNQAYSLFRDNPILVDGESLSRSRKKVNCWKMYQSEKNYTISDAITYLQKMFGGMDRTEEILDQLYESSSYGEVTEIVVSATNSLLKSDKPVEEYTAIKADFDSLAGGLNNINAILFTNPDTPERFSERDKEVCISETGVLPASNPKFNGQLECVGSKYVVDPDNIDEDYPAYIVAYRVKDTNKKYTIYVVTEDGTDMKAIGSYAGLHNGCKSMTENTFVSHMETSGVTNMKDMFLNCNALQDIDIDQFNYDNVESMANMFSNCWVLSSDGVQNISPVKPTGVDCSYMFNECRAFTEIESFDITYSTTIKGMFKNCGYLTDVTLVGAGTKTGDPTCLLSSKDTFTEVFNGAGTAGLNLLIKDVLFGNVDFSSSRNSTGQQYDWGMYWLLHSAANLKTVELNNLSFPKVYSMDYLLGAQGNNQEVSMADGFSKLESIKLIDIVAPVQRMKGIFRNNRHLKTIVFQGFDTQHLWNMSLAFQGCYELEKIVLGEGFTTYGAYAQSKYASDKKYWFDFNRTFEKCYSLTAIEGLEKIDTSHTKSMKYMFNSCYSLETLDLSGFVTAQMTDKVDNTSPFYRMFWTEDTAPYTECRLKTIYAADTFVVNDGFKTYEMFGDKLDNLTGGEGTTMSDVVQNDKKKAYYAWIDGKTTSERSDSLGYFTNSVYKETMLKQTNGNWQSAGLGEDKYKSVTSFQKTSDVYNTESEFLAFWNALPEAEKFECHDAGYAVSVYFWLDGTNLYWWSKAGTVYVNGNTSNMFRGWSSLSSLSFEGLDTSKMSNMSHMFEGCTSLTELDLSSFNTGKLSAVQGMFSGCDNLSQIYVDPFQWENRLKYGSTSVDMAEQRMFDNCGSLHGGNGTSVTAHGVKVSDVYPETDVEPEDDIDLYLSSYYAICDEPDEEDLNHNGIKGEKGYFTDIAQKQ